MGYRTFRDSKGTEWQAWDVVPQLTERREIERRVQRAPVEHADRRRQPDRRVIKGRRPTLTAGLDSGWLCFENAGDPRYFGSKHGRNLWPGRGRRSSRSAPRR